MDGALDGEEDKLPGEGAQECEGGGGDVAAEGRSRVLDHVLTVARLIHQRERRRRLLRQVPLTALPAATSLKSVRSAHLKCTHAKLKRRRPSGPGRVVHFAPHLLVARIVE